MISIISFLIVITICVISHEAGHFFVAKIFDIYVHEFSFGMGHLLWSKKGKETQYSIRAYPIGGYVKLEGEDRDEDDDENSEKIADDVVVPPERSFANKTPLQRICVLAAGATVNIFLAWLLMSFFLFAHGTYNFKSTVVGDVMDGSPAMEIGIVKGDKILSINGKQLHVWSDIYKNMNENIPTNSIYEVSFEHNGKIFTKQVKVVEKSGRRLLGISVSYLRYSFLKSCKTSLSFAFEGTKEILTGIYKMITRKIKAEVAGPVGIATMAGDAFSSGFWSFVAFIAMINLNLGIFNLLPFPALDGGRILFILPEMITGKKLPAKYENAINLVGFVLLILLVIWVTGFDIYKLFLK